MGSYEASLIWKEAGVKEQQYCLLFILEFEPECLKDQEQQINQWEVDPVP